MIKKKTRKPFPYPEFRAIYSKVPRLSVDVIVQSPDGIALTLRSLPPHQNKWHIPGGTVLYGDSAPQTARHIAYHELGLSISVPELLGYIEYNEESQRGFGHSFALVFLAKLKSGKPRPDEDASEVKFFLKPPSNTIPEQKQFLKKHWHRIAKQKRTSRD